MLRKKILLICGSNNQTTMMHKISMHLSEYDCYFTPYYSDGFLKFLSRYGMVDFTILGENFKNNTSRYLSIHNLKADYEGRSNDYELVLTCSDLIIPRNIKSKKIVLIQEGMTDPENIMYYMVKYFKLPRYLASTSTTGLSNAYSVFCVASTGYKDLFIRKGVSADKLIVTGIPNFDNAVEYLNNNFRYRNYVLTATSDARETFKYENRKEFIRRSLNIADGRQLIFKLHPNENHKRAFSEITRYAPGSITFTSGNTNHMVANCDVLITKYSSVVYLGMALNKEVYSEFNYNQLKDLLPLQNGGRSAANIAIVCKNIIEGVTFSAELFSFRFSGNNNTKDEYHPFSERLN